MPKTGDRITKRKDGRYMGRYTVHTPDGPKRKFIYGGKYAEVEKKLAEARGDAARGIVFDAENQTVGEYLERWLRDSVEGSVRPITHAGYAGLVKKHVVPELGRVKLEKLSPAHLQGLYRSKLDAGLSARTVQYIHSVLHRALKQALRWNLVPRNAAEAVDPPRVRKREIRPLPPPEARKLLEAARGDRLEALYVIAVHCGLRQAELLGLKWGDVDLEAGTLQVRRTLSMGAFTAPKTAKSRRGVKLTADAVEALKRHSARQADEMTRVGDRYEDQGLIFASEVGTPLNRHNLVARSFKPLLKRAGLPPIRFHDLRHTCATLLFSKGLHPKLVQELLGHATIAITLDTYSHVLPGMGEPDRRGHGGRAVMTATSRRT
jgi:integrase